MDIFRSMLIESALHHIKSLKNIAIQLDCIDTGYLSEIEAQLIIEENKLENEKWEQ